MDGRSGTVAALREDGADPASLRDTLEGASGSQDDLFGLALADASADLDRFQLPKRRGRPKYSRNLSTEQTKRVIRQIGGDAQMAMAKIVAGGPAYLMQLAQEAFVAAYGGATDPDGRPLNDEGKPRIVLSATDAIGQWQRAMSDLAPFLMAREAQRLEVEFNGVPVQLHLTAIAGANAAGSGAAGGSAGFTLPDQANSDTYEGEAGQGHTGQGHTGGDDA